MSGHERIGKYVGGMGYEVVVEETYIDGLYVVRRLVEQLTGFSLTISLRKEDGNSAEAHSGLELEFRQDGV